MRIAVHSLGTPLWDNRVDPNSLPVFLHSLRALLRQSYAVALLTAPTHLFDVSAPKRVGSLTDNYRD